MRTLTLLALALLPVAAVAQKSTLNATFSGLDRGTRIILSEPQGGRLVPTDTLVLDARGHLKLERRTDGPLFFTLAPEQMPGAMVHVLLLPREKVSLSVGLAPDSRFPRIASASGSANMELYRKYSNLVADAVADPALQDQLPERMEALVRSGRNELMCAFLVTYFESVFEQYAPLYKEVRDALVGLYPDHEFVRHLDQKVRTVVMVGMEAPDIVLPGPDGEQRRLSDLRGQVVLIDFWASWCRPCRMENPNVVRLYRQYHDRGFEVFSVSLDNNRDAWLNAIAADRLEWPNHVSDLRGWSSAGGKLYGISSIPATVLVDREGNILARNLRGPDLEQKLKEIFE